MLMVTPETGLNTQAWSDITVLLYVYIDPALGAEKQGGRSNLS